MAAMGRPRVSGPSEGARRLAIAMRRTGLTQEALQAEIGSWQGSISRWLHGSQKPGGGFRWKLWLRLKVRPDTWDMPPKKSGSIGAAA